MNGAPLSPAAENPDTTHLKLIEIFHFLMCGLSVLYGGFLFVHYTFMSTMFSNPEMWKNANRPPDFDPRQFFHMFVWIYILMGAWGVISLVLNLISGLCIHARKARMFSLVVAGVNCVNLPLGTVLGVFTFLILLRPSVSALYQHPQAHIMV